MILTHYIIVRRDLTVGDLVAQVAHAAGAIRETDGPHGGHLWRSAWCRHPKLRSRIVSMNFTCRECASQGSLQ